MRACRREDPCHFTICHAGSGGLCDLRCSTPSMPCSRLETQNWLAILVYYVLMCVHHQRSGPTPNAPQLRVYFYDDIHRRHRSSILNQTTH